MSHELRTPLNSMMMLSEQLARDDTNLTEKQVNYAKIINSSGHDLLTLINDILDLSKIESGTVQMNLMDVEISDVLRDMHQTYSHVADQKKLEFSVNCAKNAPASIVTDPDRLRQVLRNMLSNAFKFTEKGKLNLSIKT